MTKAEMIDILTVYTRSREAAGWALDALLDEIRCRLHLGHAVRLDGIGTLSVKPTQATTGRNPRTGDKIALPAGHKVHFSTASGLKQRLREHPPLPVKAAAE